MIADRPYQIESIEALREGIRLGKKNQVLCIPTGGGKSVCAMQLLQEVIDRKKRAVFVAERITLIDQFSAMLDAQGIPHGVHQGNHWRRQPHQLVQVASAQTLQRRGWPSADLILIDECFTGDVEILTEKGFIRFDQLKPDVRCAQFDPLNDGISFIIPDEHICRNHDGPMVRLRSDNLCDLEMTPEHELMTKWADGWRKSSVATTKFNYLKKMAAAGRAVFGDCDNNLSPRERLMIATQADGSIHHVWKDGRTTIAFSFCKQRKIDRFMELMEVGKFEWSEVRDGGRGGRRRFMVSGITNASKLLPDHFNLAELSLGKAQAIIAEAVQWDGHKHSDSSWYYSCVVQENVDFLQSVCVLAGYKSNRTIQIDPRSESYSDVHRLFISPLTSMFLTNRLRKTTRHYTGKVYCVRVPTGAIIVRRNGKPIVIGNCHVSHKDTLEKIKGRGCITIGLTATPFTKGMGKFYDGIVNVTTTNKLTDEGYLVPAKIYAPAEPDMTGVRVIAGEWEEGETSKRATKIVGDVVQEYLRHGEQAKFICFGVDVNHCRALQAQFLSAGILTELHVYTTPDEERQQNMREFRKPDSTIRGLISVSALSRGLDVPDVACIIGCRPLRSSFAEFIQVLGRGLRPYPDKQYCVVLDLAGNAVRFGDQMVEFFENGCHELDDGSKKEKKKAEPKEPKMVKCPQCSHVHKAAPLCPSCGYEYPKKMSVTHEAGELKQFDGLSLKAVSGEKQEFYAMLMSIWDEHNARYPDRPWKQGWVANQYRNKWGVWPRGMDDSKRLRPNAAIRSWLRESYLAWQKSKQEKQAV